MICTPEFIRIYSETFKFIDEKLGYDAVVEYWERIAPIALKDLIKTLPLLGCLEPAKTYWRIVLGAEGAVFSTYLTDDLCELTLNIYECPSLEILGNDAYENYCDHCTIMYKPIFEERGYDYNVERKDRGCRIRITRKKSASLATEATPAPAST